LFEPESYVFRIAMKPQHHTGRGRLGQEIPVQLYAVRRGHPDFLHLQAVVFKRNKAGRILGREVDDTILQDPCQAYGDNEPDDDSKSDLHCGSLPIHSTPVREQQ
jgi:hypothetical protein